LPYRVAFLVIEEDVRHATLDEASANGRPVRLGLFGAVRVALASRRCVAGHEPTGDVRTPAIDELVLPSTRRKKT